MAGPDYILDITSLRAADATDPPGAAQADTPAPAPGRRPWLAVHWRCCHVYNRVYRNQAGDAYQGRCPRCGREVRIGVGPEGTSNRFFEAT